MLIIKRLSTLVTILIIFSVSLSQIVTAVTYPCGTATSNLFCAPGGATAAATTTKTTSAGTALALTALTEVTFCDETGGPGDCGVTAAPPALTLCGFVDTCDPILAISGQVEGAADGTTTQVGSLSNGDILLGMIDTAGDIRIYERDPISLAVDCSLEFDITGTFTQFRFPRNDYTDDSTDIIVLATDLLGNLHTLIMDLDTCAFDDWYAVNVAGGMIDTHFDYYLPGATDQVIGIGGITVAGEPDALFIESTGGAFELDAIEPTPDTTSERGRAIAPGTSADVAAFVINAIATPPDDQVTFMLAEFDPAHTEVCEDQMTNPAEDHTANTLAAIGTTDWVEGGQFDTDAEMASWTSTCGFNSAEVVNIGGSSDGCNGAAPKPTGSRVILACDNGLADSVTLYKVDDALTSITGIELGAFTGGNSPGNFLATGTTSLFGEVAAAVGSNAGGSAILEVVNLADMTSISKIYDQESTSTTAFDSALVDIDAIYTAGGTSDTAEATSWTPATGNVPEFSLTTLLIAVLISGFVLMFIIRRKR